MKNFFSTQIFATLAFFSIVLVNSSSVLALEIKQISAVGFSVNNALCSRPLTGNFVDGINIPCIVVGKTGFTNYFFSATGQVSSSELDTDNQHSASFMPMAQGSDGKLYSLLDRALPFYSDGSQPWKQLDGIPAPFYNSNYLNSVGPAGHESLVAGGYDQGKPYFLVSSDRGKTWELRNVSQETGQMIDWIQVYWDEKSQNYILIFVIDNSLKFYTSKDLVKFSPALTPALAKYDWADVGRYGMGQSINHGLTFAFTTNDDTNHIWGSQDGGATWQELNSDNITDPLVYITASHDGKSYIYLSYVTSSYPISTKICQVSSDLKKNMGCKVIANTVSSAPLNLSGKQFLLGTTYELSPDAGYIEYISFYEFVS